MKNLSLINVNNTVLHWYFKIMLALYVLLLVGYYEYLPMGFQEYKVLLDNITLKSAAVVFLFTGMFLVFRNKFGYCKEASKPETFLGHLALLMFINIELIYFHAHGVLPIRHFDIDIDKIIVYVNWLLVLNLIVLTFKCNKMYAWGVGAIVLLFVYSHFLAEGLIDMEGNHALPGHLEFWGLLGMYLFVFYFNRVEGLYKFCQEKFCAKPKAVTRKK